MGTRILVICGIVVALTLPLLWIGGELHRENCLHQNRVDCGLLPWDNGQPKGRGWGSAAGTSTNPFDAPSANPYDR